MMSREKFVERMTQKLTYGDTISNEDIMRGMLILLAEDDSVGKTEDTSKREDFNAKAIAKAFYNAHKAESSCRIGDAAIQLKSELSIIQFTEVISEISEIDDNAYFVRDMVTAMRLAL